MDSNRIAASIVSLQKNVESLAECISSIQHSSKLSTEKEDLESALRYVSAIRTIVTKEQFCLEYCNSRAIGPIHAFRWVTTLASIDNRDGVATLLQQVRELCTILCCGCMSATRLSQILINIRHLGSVQAAQLAVSVLSDIVSAEAASPPYPKRYLRIPKNLGLSIARRLRPSTSSVDPFNNDDYFASNWPHQGYCITFHFSISIEQDTCDQTWASQASPIEQFCLSRVSQRQVSYITSNDATEQDLKPDSHSAQSLPKYSLRCLWSMVSPEHGTRVEIMLRYDIQNHCDLIILSSEQNGSTVCLAIDVTDALRNNAMAHSHGTWHALSITQCTKSSRRLWNGYSVAVRMDDKLLYVGSESELPSIHQTRPSSQSEEKQQVLMKTDQTPTPLLLSIGASRIGRDTSWRWSFDGLMSQVTMLQSPVYYESQFTDLHVQFMRIGYASKVLVQTPEPTAQFEFDAKTMASVGSSWVPQINRFRETAARELANECISRRSAPFALGAEHIKCSNVKNTFSRKEYNSSVLFSWNAGDYHYLDPLEGNKVIWEMEPGVEQCPDVGTKRFESWCVLHSNNRFIPVFVSENVSIIDSFVAIDGLHTLWEWMFSSLTDSANELTDVTKNEIARLQARTIVLCSDLVLSSGWTTLKSLKLNHGANCVNVLENLVENNTLRILRAYLRSVDTKLLKQETVVALWILVDTLLSVIASGKVKYQQLMAAGRLYPGKVCHTLTQSEAKGLVTQATNLLFDLQLWRSAAKDVCSLSLQAMTSVVYNFPIIVSLKLVTPLDVLDSLFQYFPLQPSTPQSSCVEYAAHYYVYQLLDSVIIGCLSPINIADSFAYTWSSIANGVGDPPSLEVVVNVRAERAGSESLIDHIALVVKSIQRKGLSNKQVATLLEYIISLVKRSSVVPQVLRAFHSLGHLSCFWDLFSRGDDIITILLVHLIHMYVVHTGGKGWANRIDEGNTRNVACISNRSTKETSRDPRKLSSLERLQAHRTVGMQEVTGEFIEATLPVPPPINHTESAPVRDASESNPVRSDFQFSDSHAFHLVQRLKQCENTFVWTQSCHDVLLQFLLDLQDSKTRHSESPTLGSMLPSRLAGASIRFPVCLNILFEMLASHSAPESVKRTGLQQVSHVLLAVEPVGMSNRHVVTSVPGWQKWLCDLAVSSTTIDVSSTVQTENHMSSVGTCAMEVLCTCLFHRMTSLVPSTVTNDASSRETKGKRQEKNGNSSNGSRQVRRTHSPQYDTEERLDQLPVALGYLDRAVADLFDPNDQSFEGRCSTAKRNESTSKSCHNGRCVLGCESLKPTAHKKHCCASDGCLHRNSGEPCSSIDQSYSTVPSVKLEELRSSFRATLLTCMLMRALQLLRMAAAGMGAPLGVVLQHNSATLEQLCVLASDIILTEESKGIQVDSGKGVQRDTGHGIPKNSRNGFQNDTANGFQNDTANGFQNDTANGFQNDNRNGHSDRQSGTKLKPECNFHTSSINELHRVLMTFWELFSVSLERYNNTIGSQSIHQENGSRSSSCAEQEPVATDNVEVNYVHERYKRKQLDESCAGHVADWKKVLPKHASPEELSPQSMAEIRRLITPAPPGGLAWQMVLVSVTNVVKSFESLSSKQFSIECYHESQSGDEGESSADVPNHGAVGAIRSNLEESIRELRVHLMKFGIFTSLLRNSPQLQSNGLQYGSPEVHVGSLVQGNHSLGIAKDEFALTGFEDMSLRDEFNSPSTFTDKPRNASIGTEDDSLSGWDMGGMSEIPSPNSGTFEKSALGSPFQGGSMSSSVFFNSPDIVVNNLEYGTQANRFVALPPLALPPRHSPPRESDLRSSSPIQFDRVVHHRDSFVVIDEPSDAAFGSSLGSTTGQCRGRAISPFLRSDISRSDGQQGSANAYLSDIDHRRAIYILSLLARNVGTITQHVSETSRRLSTSVDETGSVVRGGSYAESTVTEVYSLVQSLANLLVSSQQQRDLLGNHDRNKREGLRQRASSIVDDYQIEEQDMSGSFSFESQSSLLAAVSKSSNTNDEVSSTDAMNPFLSSSLNSNNSSIGFASSSPPPIRRVPSWGTSITALAGMKLPEGQVDGGTLARIPDLTKLDGVLESNPVKVANQSVIDSQKYFHKCLEAKRTVSLHVITEHICARDLRLRKEERQLLQQAQLIDSNSFEDESRTTNIACKQLEEVTQCTKALDDMLLTMNLFEPKGCTSWKLDDRETSNRRRLFLLPDIVKHKYHTAESSRKLKNGLAKNQLMGRNSSSNGEQAAHSFQIYESNSDEETIPRTITQLSEVVRPRFTELAPNIEQHSPGGDRENNNHAGDLVAAVGTGKTDPGTSELVAAGTETTKFVATGTESTASETNKAKSVQFGPLQHPPNSEPKTNNDTGEEHEPFQIQKLVQRRASSVTASNTQHWGGGTNGSSTATTDWDIVEFTSVHYESRNEHALYSTGCELILPTKSIRGRLDITSSHLYFYGDEAGTGSLLSTPEVSENLDDGSEVVKCWAIEDLDRILRRRYLLQPSAIELFFVNKTARLLHLFGGSAECLRVVRCISTQLQNRSLVSLQWLSPTALIRTKQKEWTNKWCQGEMTNFDYLMHLNTVAGRSYNDLTQYPVFPWVLSDYTSQVLDLNDPKTFRDLSKPVGALNPERLSQFHERWKAYASCQSLDEPNAIPPFLYGTHYSSLGSVLYYLLRMEPFTGSAAALQNGKFDHADRLFHSISETWTNCLNSPSDLKELTPEWFYLPSMFENINNIELGTRQDNTVLGDVVLPPWANSAADFVRKHRQALESDYVSSQLHNWIDLIFGYKQRGEAAVRADNVFYYMTYENAIDLDAIKEPMDRRAAEMQISNFGQTPSQLFDTPHPQKRVRKQVNGKLVCSLAGLDSNYNQGSAGCISRNESVSFVCDRIALANLRGCDSVIKLPIVFPQALMMPLSSINQLKVSSSNGESEVTTTLSSSQSDAAAEVTSSQSDAAAEATSSQSDVASEATSSQSDITAEVTSSQSDVAAVVTSSKKLGVAGGILCTEKNEELYQTYWNRMGTSETEFVCHSNSLAVCTKWAIHDKSNDTSLEMRGIVVVDDAGTCHRRLVLTRPGSTSSVLPSTQREIVSLRNLYLRQLWESFHREQDDVTHLNKPRMLEINTRMKFSTGATLYNSNQQSVVVGNGDITLQCCPREGELQVVCSFHQIGSSDEHHVSNPNSMKRSSESQLKLSGSKISTKANGVNPTTSVVQTLVHHQGSGAVMCVACDADQKVVVTGCQDGSIVLWEFATNQLAGFVDDARNFLAQDGMSQLSVPLKQCSIFNAVPPSERNRLEKDTINNVLVENKKRTTASQEPVALAKTSSPTKTDSGGIVATEKLGIASSMASTLFSTLRKVLPKSKRTEGHAMRPLLCHAPKYWMKGHHHSPVSHLSVNSMLDLVASCSWKSDQVVVHDMQSGQVFSVVNVKPDELNNPQKQGNLHGAVDRLVLCEDGVLVVQYVRYVSALCEDSIRSCYLISFNLNGTRLCQRSVAVKHAAQWMLEVIVGGSPEYIVCASTHRIELKSIEKLDTTKVLYESEDHRVKSCCLSDDHDELVVSLQGGELVVIQL